MGFFSKIKKLWGTDESSDTAGLGQEQPVPAEAAQPAAVREPASDEDSPQPATPAAPHEVNEPEQPDMPEATEGQQQVDMPEATLPASAEDDPSEEDTLEPIIPVTVSEPVITVSDTADDVAHEESVEEPIEQDQALTETPVEDVPSAQDAPGEIPEAPAEPATEVSPVVSTPVEPLASETSEPLPAATPRKSGGWRSFFGLAPKEEQVEPVAAARTDLRPEPKEEILFQEKPTLAPSAMEPWQQALIQALRAAEPRLSDWMTHILEGVQQRGDTLWNRLRFLFAQLEVPEQESEDFIRRFDRWLDDMEYDHVDEFRSELQYRMALALDLEDEEDERNRLFLKLSAGLGKTREQLTMRIDQLLSMAGGYDDDFWEELEEILLMADVGVNATQELIKRLRPKVRKSGSRDAADFKALLKEELAGVFREATPPAPPQGPEVVLMVGVNGAGKTTTIAKLAHRAQMQGRRVLVAAGDTFRAAAIEQLQVWAKRVGAGFYAKTHGSDPAAVAYEAMDYALKEGYDMVFVDTAGRLQTKHNLMEELKKINRVLGKKVPNAPHRTILVLDATTGQNALSQVKLFSESAPINEVILTKLDGTAKGGVIVAIALEFGIPISFVGLGEKMEDLRPFSGQEFANALFD